MGGRADLWRLCPPLLALACSRGEPPQVPPGAVDDAVVEHVYGPPGARVLTATEFRFSVAELFGAGLADTLWLPADSLANGFDNQLAGSAMSSSRLQWYDAAIGQVVEAAVRQATVRTRLDHQDVPGTADSSGGPPIGWAGSINIPADGVYTVTANAVFRPDSPLHAAILAVDGWRAAYLEWPDPVANPTTSADVLLNAGHHDISLWLASTGFAAEDVSALYEVLGPVWIDGPVDPEPPNDVRDGLVPCDLDGAPESCIREVLTSWLPRAWRRPVDQADVDRLVELGRSTLNAGGSPDDALADVLHGAMLNPRFLLHLEGMNGSSGGQADLWSLASKLSYFLWSGPPDEALRARAAAGDLADPEVLDAEVTRMLGDARATRVITGFVTQWLEIDRLDAAAPASDPFPGFSAQLRDKMELQLDHLGRTYFLQDRDLLGLVDDPMAWVDVELAAWLGVEPPPGGAGEVDLSGVGRRGLLGLPGIQTMLSPPDRTSPTQRGVWVLKRLLCSPPGDPPPTVPPLQDAPLEEPATVPALLARHASDPACSGCHAAMDPLGLVLEHFDGVGHWRDEDAGLPIEAVATLPDGTRLDGLPGLSGWLRQDPRVEACLVRSVYTWATGHPPEPDDAQRLADITARWRAEGRTFRALAQALAADEDFNAPLVVP